MEYGIIIALVVFTWFAGFVTGVKVGADLMLAKLKALTKVKTPQRQWIEDLNPNKYTKRNDD